MTITANAAWQDGEALILACPSVHEGQYLIRAEMRNRTLVVAHTCPAAVHDKECWHVKAAEEAYWLWHWWEPRRPVKAIRRAIVLSPHWQQIPIPGTELEGVPWYGKKHSA